LSTGLNWPWIAAAVKAIGGKLMIVGATEAEGTSHVPLFDPSFAPQGCVIAGDAQGFVSSAVGHWSTPDSSPDRESRLAWYRANLDPVMIDRQLLELVPRPAAS